MRVPLVCALTAALLLPSAAWAADTEPLPAKVIMGESRKGTPIVAKRQGPADAEHVLLVLGQMHGDEPYGRYVVDKLRAMKPKKNTAIWTVRTMNPDGSKLRTRRNAARVDLNRNFPDNWLPGDPASLYYSGPKAASEPETQGFIAGINQIKPDAIVSYHQHANLVDIGQSEKVVPWVRRLSSDLRLPVSRISCVTKCAGTMTGWFNNTFDGWAVTVELPRSITPARQRSMARAMVRLAPDLTPTQDRAIPTPTPTPTPTVTPTPTPTVTESPAPTPTP
jgi:murein peptide amidase A